MPSPNVVLRPVLPKEIRNVWPVVRDGLESAARFGRWIPEDAYMSIAKGEMALYLWIVDNRYAGSIILQKRTDYDGMSLHIFSLYVLKEYGNEIDDNMSQIDELARKHDCHRITFQSPRRGWEKRAARLGFVPETITFSKEV